jgi:hypothetical protein
MTYSLQKPEDMSTIGHIYVHSNILHNLRNRYIFDHSCFVSSIEMNIGNKKMILTLSDTFDTRHFTLYELQTIQKKDPELFPIVVSKSCMPTIHITHDPAFCAYNHLPLLTKRSFTGKNRCNRKIVWKSLLSFLKKCPYSFLFTFVN